MSHWGASTSIQQSCSFQQSKWWNKANLIKFDQIYLVLAPFSCSKLVLTVKLFYLKKHTIWIYRAKRQRTSLQITLFSLLSSWASGIRTAFTSGLMQAHCFLLSSFISLYGQRQEDLAKFTTSCERRPFFMYFDWQTGWISRKAHARVQLATLDGMPR